MIYFKVCRVRCKCCGDVLEYENQSKKEQGTPAPLYCSCGKVALDPSATMYRILGSPNDYEDTSEPWERERKCRVRQ